VKAKERSERRGEEEERRRIRTGSVLGREF
jgi:hypothetical protein